MVLAATGLLTATKSQAAESSRTLREYLSFSYPVDVRKSFSITDSIVAHAIGSGLVRVGEDGEIAADIAERWTLDTRNRVLRFNLSPAAKWSDGSPIRASEVADSFNDARRSLDETMPSVFKNFSKVRANGETQVDFHFAPGVEPKASVLGQFVGGACMVVKMTDGKADLRVSSGPYVLASASENDLVLKANHHWKRYVPQMIEEIHLRRPSKAISLDTLLTDPWPNVVRLGFGVLKSDLARLPVNTPKHQLNHNRVYGFHTGGRSDLESTRALISFLRGKLDLAAFADQIDDAVPALQVFPQGMELHAPLDPPLKALGTASFLKRWNKSPIRIGYYQDNLPEGIKRAIETELKRALPVAFEFVGTRNSGRVKPEHTKQFDLIFGTLGVDVDDLEEAMSYYIEADPAHFPSAARGKYDFKGRLNALRKSNRNPVADYRAILNDVVEGGFFLPVAHYSSEVLGRPGFDFSQISKFGELFPYPAVRLR